MRPIGDLRVSSVVHPVIVVVDLNQSLAFYRDLLGLVVTYDEVHDPIVIGRLTGYRDPDIRAVILQASDGTEVELAEFRTPASRRMPEPEWRDAGLRSITFLVPDIVDLVGTMRTAGVSFLSDVVDQPLPEGRVAKVVYCFDPDRVIVTLVQMPPGQRSLGTHRQV